MASDPTCVRSRFSRRDLFRTSAAAAIAAAAGTQAAPLVPPKTGVQKSVIGMPFEPRDNVRMALIGCGDREIRDKPVFRVALVFPNRIFVSKHTGLSTN